MGVPQFPGYRASTATTGSPLQIVRQMFANNAAMQITQDPDGTIRMVERGLATDILNVWIARIPFESGQPPRPRPIYNANVAAAHIFGTPEVQRFMKAFDIETPGGVIFGAFAGTPPPVAPHISGPLNFVTFSQAMDYILKGFPGIWFYENCPATAKRDRMVYFGFYHLQQTGAGAIVQ